MATHHISKETIKINIKAVRPKTFTQREIKLCLINLIFGNLAGEKFIITRRNSIEIIWKSIKDT